jgi:uridine monophosphate synthetase
MLEGRFAAVADKLFEVGAVRFGAFRLKLHEIQPDAPLSPIYLNLRTTNNPKPGPLTPELVEEIANLIYGMIHLTPDLHFRYVVGLPRAGDPLADALMKCLKSWGKVIQLRLVKEEDEGGRRIAGLLDEGDWSVPGKVLLIDDLITKADSKLEAISVLESEDLEVRDLFVLVDREQGGSEWLKEEEGVRVVSAFTLSQLLNHYVETGKIDRSKADEVKDYLAANRA